MAHPCYQCNSECYCHGDIDDAIVCYTPIDCVGCGCEEFFAGQDHYDPNDEFVECSDCDGHDACYDFGCAFDNGCGHLVNRDPAANW